MKLVNYNDMGFGIDGIDSSRYWISSGNCLLTFTFESLKVGYFLSLHPRVDYFKAGDFSCPSKPTCFYWKYLSPTLLVYLYQQAIDNELAGGYKKRGHLSCVYRQIDQRNWIFNRKFQIMILFTVHSIVLPTTSIQPTTWRNRRNNTL